MERPAIARCSRPLATLYWRSTEGIISSVKVLPKIAIVHCGGGGASGALRRHDVEVTVAARHDNNHGHYLAVCQHPVQHQVRPASQRPTIFRIGKTVEQIQHGVAASPLRVVPGRRVDHVGSLVIGVMQADMSGEEMARHVSMGMSVNSHGPGGVPGTRISLYRSTKFTCVLRFKGSRIFTPSTTKVYP